MLPTPSPYCHTSKALYKYCVINVIDSVLTRSWGPATVDPLFITLTLIPFFTVPQTWQVMEWSENLCAGHSTTKPYACDQCDFMTAYENGLAKHKYNVHEVDRKLFQCELCSVRLRSKGTYIEHIGRHFNHRKKKCEICEKTFPSKCCLCLSAFACLFTAHCFDTVRWA